MADRNGHSSAWPRAEVEASLADWRVQLLDGILITALLALLPGVLVQAWQWRHDPFDERSGWWLSLVGLGSLVVLRSWRAHYELRARILLGLGCVLVPIAMLKHGFDPGHFVVVCALSTIVVLLYSLRMAFIFLGACAAFMGLAAYLFAHGYVEPLPLPLRDERLPLNWLRTGAFVFFPSALAAVATSFLLRKLRDTLQARSQLVAELRAEVAQRERALAELENAQARLLRSQKLEAIGQLAAGIAHDFNNTLVIVALEAELLKRNKLDAAAVARGAESLLGAVERGKHLTQQLLLFSSAEHEPRPVTDGTRAFKEHVRALRRLLSSEITFELEMPSEPLYVCAPAGELQQIVLNLGINARDAMPSGGTLHMRLERVHIDSEHAVALALVPGEYALFTCRDTGSGMAPSTLQRLFEPFFTTKPLGRGTGLGLTNVWNIARRAGGVVHAESGSTQGAVLRVYLPQSDQVPADAEQPTAAEQLGGGSVLVVEDDIRVRALLVSLFSETGYEVLDAPSVDDALALIERRTAPIDLLCTDVVMPGRPARELIAAMRARWPAVQVLVCSGYSEDEHIARGIRTGEFKHLAKPFTRDALFSVVRAALTPENAP